MARRGGWRRWTGWWRSSVPGLWRLGLVLVGVFALPAAAGPDGVTYNRDIAPLLAANCQACHRDGEIAPFPLTSYDDAFSRRQKLLRTVERRKMPPWPPVPGHGDFVGERRLADADIARLRAWVEAGAPEGDPRDLPPPRTFPALWSAGDPDAVLAPASAFDVPSGDRDLYRCFVVPTAFAEDRFVSVAEFLPGDRRIVHHVIGYIDTTRAGRGARPRRARARLHLLRRAGLRRARGPRRLGARRSAHRDAGWRGHAPAGRRAPRAAGALPQSHRRHRARPHPRGPAFCPRDRGQARARSFPC